MLPFPNLAVVIWTLIAIIDISWTSSLTINCNTQKCESNVITCSANDHCTILCDSPQSCMRSIINCPKNGDCTILCRGDESCMDAIINATLQQTGDFTLKCEESGADHCKDIQVYGSVIDTNRKFGNFEVHCDGNVRSCIHAKIQCPVKGDCHIACDSESSCQWSKIQGPTHSLLSHDSALHVDCNGIMSCSDAIIHAFESSQLSITGCESYESCIDLTVFCPPNTGSTEPGFKRCFLTGNDNLGQDNAGGTIIYAVNGWNDIEVEYYGAYYKHGGKMYCGRQYELACDLATHSWSCLHAEDECNQIQLDIYNNNDNLSANMTQTALTSTTRSGVQSTQLYTTADHDVTTTASHDVAVSPTYKKEAWSVRTRAMFGAGVVSTLVFVGCYCYCNSRRKRRTKKLKAIKSKPAKKEKKVKKKKKKTAHSKAKKIKKAKKHTNIKVDVDEDCPSSSHDGLVVNRTYKPDIEQSDSDTPIYPDTINMAKGISKTSTENGRSLPGERSLAEHVMVAMIDEPEGEDRGDKRKTRGRRMLRKHSEQMPTANKQSTSLRSRYLSDDLLHHAGITGHGRHAHGHGHGHAHSHGLAERMDTKTALQLLAVRKAIVAECHTKNTHHRNESEHSHHGLGHQRTRSGKKAMMHRYGSPAPRSKSSKSDKYGAYTEVTTPPHADQMTLGSEQGDSEMSPSDHSTESMNMKRYHFPHAVSIDGDTTVGNKTDIIQTATGKDLNAMHGGDIKMEMFTPHSLSREQKQGFSFSMAKEMANPVNELPTTAPSRTCLTPSMSKREHEE